MSSEHERRRLGPNDDEWRRLVDLAENLVETLAAPLVDWAAVSRDATALAQGADLYRT